LKLQLIRPTHTALGELDKKHVAEALISVFPVLKSLSADVLSSHEIDYLLNAIERAGGKCPSLEQLWRLMDECWLALECDPRIMDERVQQFYQHPVWLLNGLFAETDAESISHRQAMVDWAVLRRPLRIADYGGGFGTLASMLASSLPDASIDVIEPYPHSLALERVREIPNLEYRGSLQGAYDLIIATDVFEHVPDPVALAMELKDSLGNRGKLLMANCFEPVIHCHLPQNMHFLHTWRRVMAALGLKATEQVAYGDVFVIERSGEQMAARRLEQRSRQHFSLLHWLPARLYRISARVWV